VRRSLHDKRGGGQTATTRVWSANHRQFAAYVQRWPEFVTNIS